MKKYDDDEVIKALILIGRSLLDTSHDANINGIVGDSNFNFDELIGVAIRGDQRKGSRTLPTVAREIRAQRNASE